MYKVVEMFTDLQDNNHLYQVGDAFPHEGMVVSDERLAELSGTNNRRRMALIEEVPEEAPESENLTAEEVEIPPVEDSEVKPKKSRKKANKEI